MGIDDLVKCITMCCRLLRKVHNFCRWICWWIYWCFRWCCRNCCRCRCCCRCPRRFVYLLDPERGLSTKRFAKEFRYFVDWSIEFECVQSQSDCHEDYPIALLFRRQTDRAGEDIKSILKYIPEDLYERTALINIHVVSNTWFLPNVSTAEKVSEFQDLGIILDFGLMDRNTCCCNYICSCNHIGGKKSKQAFEDFIKSITFNRDDKI